MGEKRTPDFEYPIHRFYEPDGVAALHFACRPLDVRYVDSRECEIFMWVERDLSERFQNRCVCCRCIQPAVAVCEVRW